MRRRDALRLGLGAAAGAAFGAAGTVGARVKGYAPLGSAEIDGAAEGVVGDGGETAYVAAGDGFVTVDLYPGRQDRR
ncbi:hypothetical protein BRD17_08120 [Halobacteriales archaeon SW_7_68_16]|nr:MAG: hypothetical protein BRD17_08120 [Halobacteriales archaeon SW_7_68_16]